MPRYDIEIIGLFGSRLFVGQSIVYDCIKDEHSQFGILVQQTLVKPHGQLPFVIYTGLGLTLGEDWQIRKST